MVPLAFGTQTGGSIVRPASYCGVYGYKPTYDTIAAAGVKPLAPGLDTVGTFARNLDDIAWFGAALSSGEPVDIPAWPGAAPRVGLTRTYEWSQAEATTVEAVETAAARLDEAGARVTEFNRINYTIVGDAVNAAQRLETLGKIVDPDAESIVLLSPVIVEALPTGFQLMDRGTHMVKGKHKALQVYQLSHEA
jgi:Asp-tRNA(Asn)/Glu-tRNA(Gln) amidotransferase A subunit family amidase